MFGGVFFLEGFFFKAVLIPVDKVAISGINRVQGVGVSAQIDVKILNLK